MPKAHPAHPSNQQGNVPPASTPSQQQPPPKRMRFNDKIALFAILAAVAIVVASAIGILVYANTFPTPPLAQSDQDATATAQAADVAATNVALQNSVPGPTVTLPADTPTPVAQTWTTTHTFTGNGPKNTSIFTAPDDWKILYTCTYQDGGAVDGAFTVEVYGADNSIIDVAINATCHNVRSTGETEEHQGGQVYLKMNSTGEWTVQVQELQ